MIGEIGSSLAQIAELASPQKQRWAGSLRESIVRELQDYADNDSYPIKPQRILNDTRQVMGRSDILISDVGAHNKRVFGLVIDFGTSQSPKSTQPLTTYLCPSRPGHQALRNNFASSLLLRT
ncbi:hypothetical protein [Thiolapillus sp.]|uniref:hypothetical protein n=1 Tax=Thiolapillus sp. TaxID=2017437 RepID=UPI0025E3D728|nr:hypothetical protein [Thiolapillus sp.]